jgi:hypothetical protein
MNLLGYYNSHLGLILGPWINMDNKGDLIINSFDMVKSFKNYKSFWNHFSHQLYTTIKFMSSHFNMLQDTKAFWFKTWMFKGKQNSEFHFKFKIKLESSIL